MPEVTGAELPVHIIMDRAECESRGQLLRLLDTLHKRLTKERENYSSKPGWLLLTGELEKLKNEARYCFADAGSAAKDALRDISGLDFTKFNMLDRESPKARYGQIEAQHKALDANSERECVQDLDRLIALIEVVRKGLEASPDIIPAAVFSSLPRPERTRTPISGLVSPSFRPVVKTATTIRDLDALMMQKSLRQSQAAAALDISTRTIYSLLKNGKLRKSARGRIACDQKFVEQFNLRHSPVKK